MRVEHGNCKRKNGIEAKSGGNLELSVAPPNSDQMAESGHREENHHTQDGWNLLQLDEKLAFGGKVRGEGFAGDRPENSPCHQDENRNRHTGVLWQRWADGAQRAPSQLH